jgi:hypothetical protein
MYMKRKDLIAELNRLTLRYNLTWDDVKVDADKAIAQVNSTLGANFPPLTERYLSDDSEYADRIDGVDVPVIKDIYFYTVIIPFISLEILSRDEEFTTIFSKFQQDLMAGKFQMFSNEFNHIPDKYKRTRVEGVFFPSKNLGK